MNFRLASIILACCVAACSSGGEAGGKDNLGDGGPLSPPEFEPDYFPTDDWRRKAPEELGYDPIVLQGAVDFAGQSSTQGLLIAQDGYVVAESYFRGFTSEMPHESFSMAKSFASALIGVAIDEGLLAGVEERLCEYYPAAWDCEDAADPRSEIALRHVMTLSSGLEWNEDWSPGANLLQNDAVLMSQSVRPIAYVLQKAAAHQPGTFFQYSTGDPALLSGVLQSVTGKSALEYGREKIFDVIGATSIEWASDADGQTRTYAGLSATVRDYARFGFLYLNRGRWGGTQVVPADWVDVSTQSGPSLQDWYGYLWHVNLPLRFEDPALPADGYTAQGVSGQFITVIPSERLVLVRVADDGIGAAEFDIAGLVGRVLAAKH